MADRTSAALFGEIFRMLASDKRFDRKALAKRFWEMSEDHDFSAGQMGCDDALEKLGLARHGIDQEYPEDGKVLLYGPVVRKGKMR